MAGGWGVGGKPWPGRAEENLGDLGIISLMPESKSCMKFSILECDNPKFFASGGSIFEVM